ncbi:MAG: signal recognition particle-docking protein FtsY [Methanobrevibacter wolinii]|uniref:signal recognition particle-docking protein FtsY n=1 Tax=Methanobrevibacter wolinii TaxID=190977 RepID=UPI0005B2BC81|nr:signal recognition particle-docking protein FtsY [Methanobrevibacter wolinii]
MFESLKKKFSRTSNQLTDKVTEEAKSDDNIESIEPIEEKPKKSKSSKNSKDEEEWDAIFEEEDNKNEKSGFFSRFSRNKNDSKEESEDNEELKEELDTVDESLEELEEDSDNEDSGKKHWYSRKKEPEQSIADKYRDDLSAEEIYNEIEEEDNSEVEEEKGGVFSFFKEKTISEDDVEDILWELEIGLLEGDVAIDVANEIVESVKKDLVGKKIKRSTEVGELTYKALKKAVAKIINVDGKSMTELLEEKNKEGKPLVVMLVGINGTGKTTTVGKLANYYLKRGYTPVIAASDTFRAGAIEQVTQHADNVGVKIIKHQKGSDPAAVAYDAVEHAVAQGKDLVLIDTAGRMQTNTNLMDEMKKIKRVAKPDLVIFVGDALTGNDAVEQASKFNDAIDIDGVILTKADADAKGGASLSIGYIINKPIFFLGMGQGYDDIREYNPEWMLDQLFS